MSHAGKALIISHTQHKAPPILTPISNIGKEWGHEEKQMGLTSEVRKTGKNKKVKLN